MIRSMTGFGRSSIETKKGSYVVEIQSVNRRFLEATVYVPKEYLCIETDIRKVLAKKISRGQIIVRLSFYPLEDSVQDLLPDIKLLKNLKKGWEDLSRDLGFKEHFIDINFLSHQLKLLPRSEKFKDLSSDFKEIMKCVDAATDELISMKEKEGELLLKDMKKRIKLIESLVLKIEGKSKTATADYEKKLKERLEGFAPKGGEIDERVLKEIAIYADKIDITEEITRLKSHIEQFNLFCDKKEVIGRKMDFLLQEMTREINTISSKSSCTQVSIYVVDVKSELEKIREQVQNIE